MCEVAHFAHVARSDVEGLCDTHQLLFVIEAVERTSQLIEQRFRRRQWVGLSRVSLAGGMSSGARDTGAAIKSGDEG